MTRRLMRTLIGGCCRASGILSLAERRNRRRLTILCYHRVLPADRKAAYFVPDLVVTPEAFRQHCQMLARHFRVLPLSEAIALWRQPSIPQRPIAAMTFDDGYRDNAEYAVPILNEVGLRATFFVTAGLVGAVTSAWYDRLARSIDSLCKQERIKEVLARPEIANLLEGVPDRKPPSVSMSRRLNAMAKALSVEKRHAFVEQMEAAASLQEDDIAQDLIMTWSQLASLANAGHEIGSHSLTHEILTQLDDASLAAEVTGSREVFEKKLGRSVQSFCFPNGDTDDRIIQAVEAGGYRCAVTVMSGCNEPEQNSFRLKRWFMHEDRLCGPLGQTSATLLRMELCGLADRAFCRQQARMELS